MLKKQAGCSDGITLLLVFLIVLSITIGVFIWSRQAFLISEKIWAQNSGFVTDAQMGNFYFLSDDKYSTERWSYTELSNGDILINPFEMHLLCYIKSIPASNAITSVSTKDIIQAKQNHARLLVKPISVNWQDTQNMQQRLKTCPSLESSGENIFYQGHRVLELIEIRPTHQSYQNNSF